MATLHPFIKVFVCLFSVCACVCFVCLPLQTCRPNQTKVGNTWWCSRINQTDPDQSKKSRSLGLVGVLRWPLPVVASVKVVDHRGNDEAVERHHSESLGESD